VLAAFSVSILLALLLAGCDQPPNGPSPPLVPHLARFEIVGPGSIAPGGTEQFRANALFSDGSQRDVTGEAAWTSENHSVVTVSPVGLASGNERGETEISAAYSQAVNTKRVFVVPPGTFKLSGRVLDGNVGVTGARVEVAAGSATGLSTVTQDGRFVLYGVSGQTQIRVSKEGYQPRTENLEVTDHRNLEIPLFLLRPPWDPSGRYTLTIAAAPECRTVLPEDAWLRRYTAVVQVDTDPRFANVTLQGADFVSSNFWFWLGRIGETTVTFEVDSYYYGPALVERLSSSRFLFIVGRAEVARSPAGLEGHFDGTLQLGEGEVWYNTSRAAPCRSANHRFTFSR
jgi:hypothetical protein